MQKNYYGDIISPSPSITLSDTPNVAQYIASNTSPSLGGTVNQIFGVGGRQTISFGTGTDIAQGMALQPDGKTIAAGYANVNGANFFAITRLNSNGSLDRSFNGTGTKTVDFQGVNDQAYAVALQSDGAIVVFGISTDETTTDGILNYSFAITRLNSTGTLDTTFNRTGKLLVPPATYNGANTCTSCITNQQPFPQVTVANSNAITIQQDGTILLLGTVRYAGTNGHSFAITQLTSTGQFDLTFNGTGFVTIGAAGAGSPSPAKGQCAGYAVVLQSNGYIVLGGGAESSLNRYLGTILRITPTGTLDVTFNTTGFYQFSTGTGVYGNDAYTTALAVQPSDQKNSRSRMGSLWSYNH